MFGFKKTLGTVSIVIFSIISLLVPSVASADGPGVSVTPATGGTGISIDTTSLGGTNISTSITGPTIEETAIGQIGMGDHVIVLPAGWEFDIFQNVSVALTGGTGLTLELYNIIPQTNSLTFTVTHLSSISPGKINFGNFHVRPTATIAPVSVNIYHDGALIDGVTNGPGGTNFGTISAVHGAATKVRVVTLADESGEIIPDQSITADESLIGYSIRTDQFDNFIDNAASTWSLVAPVGVVNGDLVPAEDNKSATLVGNLVGTATIRVVIDGLDSVDSGIITVTPGVATTVTIAHPPASAGSVDVALTDAPIAHVVDSHGNAVADGTHVVASKVSGNGNLSGTPDVTTVGGNATFSDLHYDKIDAFTIKFTSNGHDSPTSNAVTLTAGAPTTTNAETAANGSGAIVSSQTIDADHTVTIYSVTRDQFNNFVANAAAVWSLPTKTGRVLNGDLVPEGDNKSAIFYGNLIGTAIVRAAAAGTSNDSGTITVIHGALAGITVTPDVVSISADSTQDFISTGNDSNGNTWDVTANTAFTINEAPADGGSFTGVTYRPNTVGIYTVHGEDGEFFDDTTSITVTPGVATSLTVSGVTDTVMAGVTSDVVVTAKDQHNNTAT